MKDEGKRKKEKRTSQLGSIAQHTTTHFTPPPHLKVSNELLERNVALDLKAVPQRPLLVVVLRDCGDIYVEVKMRRVFLFLSCRT